MSWPDRNEGHVVCVGELLWDLFPSGERVLGGAPANVAVQLAKLSVRPILVSRVGSDELGYAALAKLHELGISRAGIQLDGSLPTGWAYVTLSTKGRVNYRFNTPAAWDAIESVCKDRPNCVVFGTLAQRDSRSRRAIREIAQVAAERIYDVNLRPPFTEIQVVMESFALSTVVKMSESEATAICRALKLPEEPFQFGRAIRDRFGPRMVCVTRGAQGAWMFVQDGVIEVRGISTKAGDPVGAGDAFLAGIIQGMLSGAPWQMTLQRANELGARVASSRGATLQSKA